MAAHRELQKRLCLEALIQDIEDDGEESDDDYFVFSLLREHANNKMKAKRRKYAIRPQGEFRALVRPMRDVDHEAHTRYFRMSAATFDRLTRLLEPYVKHAATHSAPIDLCERLAVTLRVLASGCSQSHVAASYKMGSRTVCGIVSEMCCAIWEALRRDFVRQPSTEQEWADIAGDFWRLWNFPNCVGAVGGRRIVMRSPTRGSDYKDGCAVVLLAACDARSRFTVVDVGTYPRHGDTGVFHSSRLGSKLLEDGLQLPPPADLPGSTLQSPFVLVGSSAFPMHVHLMQPFQGSSLTDEQKVYNYRHCRAQRLIENSLGILVARWRILGRAMDCASEKAEIIVRACVALHNFLTSVDTAARTQYIPPSLADVDDGMGGVFPGEWRGLVAGDGSFLNVGRVSDATATRAAIATRNGFVNFFHSPEGQVPWQEACLSKELVNA